MSSTVRPEAPLLLVGDILFLVSALFGTLFIRSGEVPDQGEFLSHLLPFTLLFLLSTVVFHIAGLYNKHTLLFKSRLSETIFFAQLANILVAALFFFLVPYFGIQPKTNLFLYLLLSTALVSFWRIYLFPLFGTTTHVPAILVGAGEEASEIFNEVNGNTRYAMRFLSRVETNDTSGESAKRIVNAITASQASVIVIPFTYMAELAKLPEWEPLVFSGKRFVDLSQFYEDVFDRVSISNLDYRRLIEDGSRAETLLYGVAKRIIDVVICSIALVVFSPLILLIAFVLTLGEARAAFIFQKRIGREGAEIRIIKFRTMLFDDEGDVEKQKTNRVTKFGAFLRKTQLDEIPQFWNVMRGDLSLIGPRPEIPALTREYEKQIPFYHTRHMIQPGISGWAQIKHASPPKWKLDVDATRHKLSYDLYYLKHRSLIIDLSIVLQTVKILLQRAGI